MTRDSTSRYEYSVVDFTESLRASFIGSDKPADERYSPRILVNSKDDAIDVLSVLKRELNDCKSFDFSVAFITSSGIQTLIEIFNLLKQKGIKGRILTSTYLNFNDPAALRKLLSFPNIEARVYEGNLHAKGYFFNNENLSTFIIGSSNLTQKALTCNREWNVLFRSSPNGEILSQAKQEFEELWNDPHTVPIEEDWISQYEQFLAEQKASIGSKPKARQSFSATLPSSPANREKIEPNQMQQEALKALATLHQKQEKRALLISATGTGKTYLSALDVEAVNPQRILFIAHRKRILSASLESYQRVLGDSYTYGMYGTDDISDKTCVFAMVNSLSRHLDEFDPSEFDYIVIDEAHRTGANSYRKLLDYFSPKFFLGMTATPSRTDGYDVYSLFNHIIAYRITLQDALRDDMLAPFHYFGIADLSIDEENLDDVALFAKLTSESRVKHIANKIEEYTVEKERKGLIFCSRNDEAAEVSYRLNDLGYRTIAISGESSDKERDDAIAKLENGEIEYILSVDIFNEGVDIPSVNQIIMLRPTESAVVFMQQLGRGLRRYENKEYTLVLDFIGNYQQNFLIPVALSGDRTYNKDTLRRMVKEGSVGIPGCSTVSFDRISEQRIFKSLEQSRFSEAKLLRSEYQHLKQILGRIPRLIDFDEQEAIDPMIIIKKYGSYPAFLQSADKDMSETLSAKQLSYLKFLSLKLASGKRRGDLLVLKSLLGNIYPVSSKNALPNASAKEVEAIASFLEGRYSTAAESVATFSNGSFALESEFLSELRNPYFYACINDLITFALSRNDRDFSKVYKDTDFVLYQKYSREEICRLLRWRKEPNYQNIGGYFFDEETSTFPVFIDYEKDPSISVTTQYEDRFISESKLIALSKSKRTLTSPEIKRLSKASENRMRCYLFMRKNKNDKDEGKEFYFLGEMHPTGTFREILMSDESTKAVEIEYELEHPVRRDLYDYLTSNIDSFEQDSLETKD